MKPGSIQHTVNDLKAAGWRVRLRHYRRVERYDHKEDAWRPIAGSFMRHVIRDWGYGYRIAPRGGETVAMVTPPDGQPVIAEARCSISDTFSCATGTAIALGRALAAVEPSVAIEAVASA